MGAFLSPGLRLSSIFGVGVMLSLIVISCQSRTGDKRDMNHLKAEKSPYLQQHADNPVHWYPWGDAAFEKARREDKPIFLSIGYSTCHWCHVMARESFEDPEVARLMNDTFVSIKVDREERPDIDNLYMRVCQMMTGHGGWPLTIIMTPEKKPFYAGTYIPKESRFGRIGMLQLIPRVRDLWENKRGELLDSANEITQALQKSAVQPGDSVLDREVLGQAYDQLATSYDHQYGGFGQSPKFPSPHTYLFLLRYWRRTENDECLQMVENSLRAMRKGGIYDHVGFGFHRYSTDEQWLLPHFEKMLYDQAMLSLAYMETYQATGDKLYAETARDIFTYLFRDMQSPAGGFYAAQNAESEGEEGKFYVWKHGEIQEILPEDETDLVTEFYNINKEGNFSEESTGKKTGDNILHQIRTLREFADSRNDDPKELAARLEAARNTLFQHRQERTAPETDEKILTDWNGLVIASLARAGRVLEEEQYVTHAQEAKDFLLREMRKENGRLTHRYIDGSAAVRGTLSDYTFLTWGLLELYETTYNVRNLEIAVELMDHAIRHFWDEETGGFYFTPDYGEELITRQKEIQDGALPSSNSVALNCLVRLSRITGDQKYSELADLLGKAFANQVRAHPSAYTMLLTGLDLAVGPSYEVVITGEKKAEDTRQMLSALHAHYLPNAITLFRPAEDPDRITEISPFTQSQTPMDSTATAYVCQNFVCNQPTTDIDEMLEQLDVI